MASMSYCRFENTYRDLEDCVEDLENKKHLSETEYSYMKYLLQTCKEYIELAEDYENPEEEEDDD